MHQRVKRFIAPVVSRDIISAGVYKFIKKYLSIYQINSLMHISFGLRIICLYICNVKVSPDAAGTP